MSDWRLSIAVAQDHWASRMQQGTMADGTAARYMRVFEAFCRYAVASGVADAGGATARLCERFAAAPMTGDRSPTGSTAGVRLAAIRDAFDGLVEAGVAAQNPALGLRVSREPATVLPRP